MTPVGLSAEAHRRLDEFGPNTVGQQVPPRWQGGAGSHASPYSAMIGEVIRGEITGGPIKGLSITRVMVHRFDRPVSQTVVAIMKIIRDEVKRVATKSKNAIKPSGPAMRSLPSD